MKEEPAFRFLSRRTLLGRVSQVLGVTFVLGYGNRRGCDETACGTDGWQCGRSEAVDADRHSRDLCHLALADAGEESGFPRKNSKWGPFSVDTNN